MSGPNASRLTRFRRRTYEILDGAVVDRASHACEIFIALLVVANVVAIILESVHSIHEEFELYFHYFDLQCIWTGRFFQYRPFLFATAVPWGRLAGLAHVPFDAYFQTVAIQQRDGGHARGHQIRMGFLFFGAISAIYQLFVVFFADIHHRRT